MEKILVRVKNNLDYEEWLSLVELVTYYKLSYPVGVHETCEISMNDKEGRINTNDVVYQLPDELYMKLHLITNSIIANLYKTV